MKGTTRPGPSYLSRRPSQDLVQSIPLRQSRQLHPVEVGRFPLVGEVAQSFQRGVCEGYAAERVRSDGPVGRLGLPLHQGEGDLELDDPFPWSRACVSCAEPTPGLDSTYRGTPIDR